MAQKAYSMALDINVVSAGGLAEVDATSKTKLYVVVSITGAAQNEQKAQTHVDKDSGGNPTWNFPLKFAVDVDGLKQDLKTRLVFALKYEDGKGGGHLGEVHVSIAELLQSAGVGNSMQYVAVSYPVKKPSGQTAGVLNFEYKFGVSPTSDTPTAGLATRSVGGYPPQGYYYPPPPPTAAGYGGYPPSPYPPPSPSHYMPPQPYPPYNIGHCTAPPYAYPPHQNHVQARAPPVGSEQRSMPSKKKNKSWKMGAKMLGKAGALAVGVLSGGSAPDVSDLTSGFEIPDPSASAPPDFSNLYTLPDPSALPGPYR